MSDSFGVFEAAHSDGNEISIEAQAKAQKLQAAIYDVGQQFGPFLYAATGLDDFDTRVALVKDDMIKTVMAHLPPVTGIMRRVVKAHKAEFKNRGAGVVSDDWVYRAEMGGVGSPDHKAEVEKRKHQRNDPSLEQAKEYSPKSATRRTADETDPAYEPEGDFEAYLRSVDTSHPEVNFSAEGFDKASSLAMYQDWCHGNGLRVASLKNLEAYGPNVSEPEFRYIEAAIRQAADDKERDHHDNEDEYWEDLHGPGSKVHEKGKQRAKDIELSKQLFGSYERQLWAEIIKIDTGCSEDEPSAKDHKPSDKRDKDGNASREDVDDKEPEDTSKPADTKGKDYRKNLKTKKKVTEKPKQLDNSVPVWADGAARTAMSLTAGWDDEGKSTDDFYTYNDRGADPADFERDNRGYSDIGGGQFQDWETGEIWGGPDDELTELPPELLTMIGQEEWESDFGPGSAALPFGGEGYGGPGDEMSVEELGPEVIQMMREQEGRDPKRFANRTAAGTSTNTGQEIQKAEDSITGLLNSLAEDFQASVMPLQQALQAIEYAKQVAQQSNPMGVMPAGGLSVLPPESPTGGPALGQPAFADPAAMAAGGAPAPGGMPPGGDPAAGGDPMAALMADPAMAAMLGGGGAPPAGPPPGDPAAGGPPVPPQDPAAQQPLASRRPLGEAGGPRQASTKEAWTGWGHMQQSSHRQAAKQAGWNWNHRLNGYEATNRSEFPCECGIKLATPGFHRCACGKQWNSYAIGTFEDMKTGSARRFICREIPTREGVIVANKKQGANPAAQAWQNFVRSRGIDDQDTYFEFFENHPEFEPDRHVIDENRGIRMGSKDFGEAFGAAWREARIERRDITVADSDGDGEEPEMKTMRKQPDDWAHRDNGGKWTPRHL